MARLTVARAYLVAFNLVSFFGWTMILTTLIRNLSLGPQQRGLPSAVSQWILHKIHPTLGQNLRILSYGFHKHLPPQLVVILDRASMLHAHSGALVAVVQSLAVLEILHALLGLVKTPVGTTVIQVFSRLFLVWGIAERYKLEAASPWYASMVFAWSVTECIRYPFYANALMGSETSGLLWARYTFFYVLYPLGAASEAMLMFSTLPSKFPWQDASAWSVENYVIAGLFVIWWPGLYVMYSHMRRQRRKALGGGRNKVSARQAAQIAEQRKKGVQAVADGTWATGESKKSK